MHTAPPPTNPFAAILLAAGTGTRFGSDKIFQALGNRPVLEWSLRAFQSAPSIEAIVLVTGAANHDAAARLLGRGGYPKVRHVCLGGARRQDSVWNGLQLLVGVAWVLIHDAARPFVSVDLIERCVRAARQAGGAIAAVPVKDTIKVVGASGRVEATPTRERLWAAQTPQVFRYDWLIESYLLNGGEDVTDDAEVYERAGFPVAVVPSSYDNFKLTTPDDLVVARAVARSLPVEPV